VLGYKYILGICVSCYKIYLYIFSPVTISLSETDECDWESDVAVQRCLEESLDTSAVQINNERYM